MLVVIHILHHGLPLCDAVTKIGIPRYWKPGHKWVRLDDPDEDEANCPDCKAAYRRRRGLTVKQLS
jgi:hypothetical protein